MTNDRLLEILLTAGARSLKPNERWCILHPEGPLLDTASTDFTYPVRVLCCALDMDWDDLTEQGYSLGKINMITGDPINA